MAEYNKKNCFIIKQIFNINNEFKINLYEGDSLKLDIKKEFGIDKFDIVIGNPPYNEELKTTGAKALYNKFVEYYIEKCDLLSFVIPSRWFSGGKGLDSFRKCDNIFQCDLFSLLKFIELTISPTKINLLK
jgi:hypothetical protein